MKIFNTYFWKDLYYNQISTRIWPRQRWLTKIIPREHKDKDSIIELILFKCLTEYVESEIGVNELFDKNRWKDDDDVPKHQLKFENELKEYYLLLTEELPRLQKILDDEWRKVPFRSLDDINNSKKEDYKTIYGKVDEAELAVENLKDKIILWIVLNKKSMWS